MRSHGTLRLGRSRLELETELVALTEQLHGLTGRMKDAAERHDTATVEVLAIEAGDVDRKVEEDAFLLELIYESTR